MKLRWFTQGEVEIGEGGSHKVRWLAQGEVEIGKARWLTQGEVACTR